MIHKIKNITIAAFSVLFVLNACDLNRIPETNLSDGVFWQNENDFKEATRYLYMAADISISASHYPLFADVMSDNAIHQELNDISNGTYLPSADFGPWDQDYRIIRAANNIIEKADVIEFESIKMPLFKAEARFFRAYAYADLIRRYGDVPLIMRTLDVGEEELFEPRVSVEVVLESIYSDLDYAAENLLSKEDLSVSSNYSEVTKGAALALKSRVALRQGTWNKFHNNANYDKHLQIAKDASKAVLDGMEYNLFDLIDADEDYKQLFKASGIGPENREAIWVWQYGIDNDNRLRFTNYGSLVSQGDSISRSLVDSYLFMDGLPFNQSPLYEGQLSSLSDFNNRDPRLNGLVVKKGEVYNVQEETYTPNLIAASGYTIQKYFELMEESNERNGTIDLIVIRYAEVLLNYAEATFELNDVISDADLDISINLLRSRVGMPDLSNAFVAANNLNMQGEIRRERRVELAMEGFRYDDLLRWKTAEIELPKAILGVRLFVAEYPGVDPSGLNYATLNGEDSILVIEPADKRYFDPAKNYLWPLPLDQMGLNPNLEQNPGWN